MYAKSQISFGLCGVYMFVCIFMVHQTNKSPTSQPIYFWKQAANLKFPFFWGPTGSHKATVKNAMFLDFPCPRASQSLINEKLGHFNFNYQTLLEHSALSAYTRSLQLGLCTVNILHRNRTLRGPLDTWVSSSPLQTCIWHCVQIDCDHRVSGSR